MNNPTDNKRIATTTVGIICLTIAVVLCCVATFAWFDNSVGSLDFPTNFGGSSMAAYFNGGNGSQGTPYEIDNPTNLYNLAWLCTRRTPCHQTQTCGSRPSWRQGRPVNRSAH